MSNEKRKISQHLSPRALEHLAGIFRAFAEPSRLAILQELKGGPLCVGDLVKVLGCTQANVSSQLKILYDQQLVDRERRGNQVFYSIKDDIVFDLCELACGKLNRQAMEGVDLHFSV